jgi:hypothetical protein
LPHLIATGETTADDARVGAIDALGLLNYVKTLCYSLKLPLTARVYSISSEAYVEEKGSLSHFDRGSQRELGCHNCC